MSRPSKEAKAHRPRAAPTRNRTWPMMVGTLRARTADEASMNDMVKTLRPIGTGGLPPPGPPASASRDVSSQEVREGPGERRDAEQRADPCGADHGGPVNRLAQ